MRPVHLHLALTVAAGAVLGLFGGNATIAGMAPPASLNQADDSTAPSDAYEPGASADTMPEKARDARIADACADCSDYDLGFRFAAARHVRDSARCMDFTWSYQRGCLAWLRES